MEDELQVTWSSDVIIVPNEDLSRRELARLKRILVVPYKEKEKRVRGIIIIIVIIIIVIIFIHCKNFSLKNK